jgi:aminopeptidase N
MTGAGLVAALICAISLPAAAAAPATAAHDIHVRIDPETHRLEGRDTIRFDAPRAATLLLSARFRIDALAADGRRVQPAGERRDGLRRIALPAARKVELRWSGTLATLDPALDHRATLSYAEPSSGAQGTFLPSGSGWYAAAEGMLERYRLELDLPAGQRGLVPGRLLEESEAGGRYRARFEFAHPAEGISLMAGPYRVAERRVRTAAGSEVLLRTYFHGEIAELAPGYLDSVAAYLDLYERRIGAYPFSEFSVVSSPTPTGFGMPALTYLGIEILRLPFIRATSLGHEVLHNWWGNGVYPDSAHGNWSEGLTTFMADYAYRERDGADAAHAARLAWLRDYAAMPPEDDAPLAGFTSRTHGASQIVGYNKAAMLFFMLRELIGEAAFDEGLRRFWRDQVFRVASWSDLRSAFERASGRALGDFFGQWLERPGAPQLSIADAHAVPEGSGWRLSVTLSQGGPAYALSVPLAIRGAEGEVIRRMDIARERETAEFELPAQPLALALDPELRLFRRLAPGEAPPILREAMLAQKPALLLLGTAADLRPAADQLAARLFERPDGARAGAPPTLIIGLPAEIDAWLAKEGLAPRPPRLAPSGGSAQVWTLRAADARTMVLVSVRDAQSLAALARPLPHYGRESYLVFDAARAIDRGSWPTRPQVRELR